MPLYVRTFIYINFTATVTAPPHIPSSVAAPGICSCCHYAAPSSSSSSSSRSPHPNSVSFRHSVSAKAHASPMVFALYFFVFYEPLVKRVYRNLRFIICKMKLKSGLSSRINSKLEPQSCVPVCLSLA